MEKRIGISAAILGFSPGIVLGIFEVMGWKMPEQLAVVLVVIMVVAGVIALVVLLHSIWIWTRRIRNRYALQFPVYRRDKPNPLRWLIDRAEEQRDNPLTHLVVTDRIWSSFDRHAKSPYLALRIFYTNLGLYDLKVGQPEGYAYYNSDRLPDRIISEGGLNNVPAGAKSYISLNVYIPPEFLEDVCKEVESDTKELRGLELREIKASVHIKDDARQVWWLLGAERTFFRSN